MLKTRLIPVLYIKNGLIVRSEKFAYHQNLGNVVSEAKRYSDWDVDELIYIDISREAHYDLRRDDLKVPSKNSIIELIKQIAAICHCPLTFGGGIRTLDDIKIRIANGADKVTLNSAAYLTPELISQAASLFGSQCLVGSVDYKLVSGIPMVYVNCGRDEITTDLLAWVKRLQDCGMGEILLNAIDRDGMANGYDLATITAVSEAVSIPVIACGGAGTFEDFVEVAKATRVSAIAAGNIFHFTERSYPRAKEVLRRGGVRVR